MSISIRRWRVFTFTLYSLAAVAGLLCAVFIIALGVPETLWAYRDLRLPVFSSFLAALVSILLALFCEYRGDVAARKLRQRLGID